MFVFSIAALFTSPLLFKPLMTSPHSLLFSSPPLSVLQAVVLGLGKVLRMGAYLLL